MEAGTPAARWELRGVLEGFHGRPWRHHDRLRLMSFLARHGLNAYVYAPPRDPLRGLRWRQPYPSGGGGMTVQRFRALATQARAEGIQFVVGLNPSDTLAWDDPEDELLLAEKFEHLLGLGVQGLLLAFTEAPMEGAPLGQPPPLAVQVEVANRLLRRLVRRGHDPLPLMLPSPQAEGQDLAPLGDLDPRYRVLWMDPSPIPRPVAPETVLQLAGAARRPPVLWHAFPANDWRPDRVILTPFPGLSPAVEAAVGGLLVRPMTEAKAGQIPLATVAEFLRAPESYRPEEALAAALQEAAAGDPGSLQVLTALAEYAQVFFPEDPEAADLREPVAALPPAPGRPDPSLLQRIEAALHRLEQLGEAARRGLPHLIAGELRPWARAAVREAQIGLRAVHLLGLEAPHPEREAARVELSRLRSALRRSRHALVRETVLALCDRALAPFQPATEEG